MNPHLTYNPISFEVHPDFNEMLFCFILANIIFVVAFFIIDRKMSFIFPWLLILIYSLFAFHGSDYFTYKSLFGTFTSDFRDPLYFQFQKMAFGSYIVFRLLIWGVSIIFLCLTAKRLRISSNILYFTFSLLFLLTFSYARASLAMASYFFGLSFLISPLRERFTSLFIALALFIFAYFAHRSLLPILLVTPMAFVRLNKKRFLFMLLLIPVAVLAAKFFFSLLNKELIKIAAIEGFIESSSRFITFAKSDRNIHAMMLSYFKYFGFYVTYLFAMWKLCLSNSSRNTDLTIQRYMTISTFIIIIATSFFILSRDGLNATAAYRYLFMTGIPVSLALAHAYEKGICSKKELIFILGFPLIHSEINLIGLMVSRWNML